MNISFKGYDAAPLKALHISQSWDKVGDEFKQICDKENIDLKASKFNGTFNQDVMIITEQNGKPCATVQDNVRMMSNFVSDMQKEYNMPVELVELFDNSTGFVSGGNFFLGKKPDGKKFLLLGNTEKSLLRESKIAKRFDVDKKDIHYISQQDYHIDLSIRPIGYPYVLVNNPKLALKNEFKAKGDAQKNTYKNSIDKRIENVYKKNIEELQNAGFVPIPIGAVYETPFGNVNFMNAIVNKHDDGSISYITNSSKCNNPFVSKYQRIFEKDLRNKLNELRKIDDKVPQLNDIYFIQGENYGTANQVMVELLEGSGGVHCMATEEPNFEKWA